MEPRIQRILITTAFKELSFHASPYAAMLARVHDAQIHVIHVASVTPVMISPGLASPGMPVTSEVVGPAPDEVREEARGLMQQFVHEHLGDVPERVVQAVLLGEPVSEIVRYAVENKIDMIVMGTHGDGLLRRIVFGSISKKVLEYAPCPVLLVPVHASQG